MLPMKTLIFNGSPRKSGDTAALLDVITKALEGEVKIVSAYYDDILPCIDCRQCWKEDGCAIQDGMQDVYLAMRDYDNIIVASPIYFSQLTGELMNIASRLQCLYAAKRFRGTAYGGSRKKGALILAGGGDGNEKPAQSAANLFFKYANAECIGTVLSLNTDVLPAFRDEAALSRARELALELNRLYRSVL
jgi:multimeric flavodoxin WrbA